MKRILDTLNKEEFIKKNSKIIHDEVYDEAKITYDKMSDFGKKVLDWKLPIGLIILLFFSIIFTIPILIALMISSYQTNKFLKLFSKEVNIFELHKLLFKDSPIEAHVENLSSSTKLINHAKKHRKEMGIPSYADIHKKTNAFKVTSQVGEINYIGIVWHWVTRSDKQTHDHYYNVTNIVFYPSEISRGLEKVNLILHDMWKWNSYGKLKKINLESRDFNKRFTLLCDDELKATMIYTPYYMEKTLENYQKIRKNIRNFFMEKKEKKLSMTYMPKSLDHIFINLRYDSKKGFGGIVDSIVKDIVLDFYDFYSTFEILLLTNINKWKI